MYTPPAFREDDPAILHAVIRAARLAVLVSAAPDGGAPEATHLPLLLDAAEGPHGTLYGHVAKANPQWRALASGGPARAIFAGPEAYVSPSLYASKAEHGKVVPTWNYVAVHAIGPVALVEDAAGLHALVSRLTDHHEA
ncbi:MAG: FMN-binding negative transcriptional regulator, partial [Roseomonas sp.]|nr:FMN-binding negative transcriptional regulator [Roseomonas sp.]